MKENIIIALLYAVFLLISFLYSKLMVSSRSKLCYFTIPFYLIFIKYYFDSAIRVKQYLATNKILALDFGQADILMALLLIIIYVTSMFFLGSIFYKRYKKYAA